MNRHCRILLLENDVSDAELIRLELQKAGLDFDLQVVAGKDDFLLRITADAPDVILSDYTIPGFDGMSALNVARAIVPQTPFIIVTGSVSEEVAVECMKAGATDYLLKHRLLRLGPVVKLALENKQAQEARAQLESVKSLLAAIVESSADAIISKDLNSIIVAWNQGAEGMFGYTAAEAIGQPVTMLMPPELVKEERGIMQKIRSGERLNNYETVRVRKDGLRIDVSLTVSPVNDAGGRIVGASQIARDITAQRLAEARVRASLREKELLLKEVYHRVKNNLQIISSLLNLQSSLTTDDAAQAAMNDCTQRIQAMALLHEQLYLADDLMHVNMHDYLRMMVGQLTASYGARSCVITPHIEVEQNVTLGMDSAIPCGLMIHELYSNCVKHAFTGRARGRVTMRMWLEADWYRLAVEDDGVGFPGQVDFRNTTTLGLQLVCTLVNQLRGNIRLHNENGTKFAIVFPKKR